MHVSVHLSMLGLTDVLRVSDILVCLAWARSYIDGPPFPGKTWTSVAPLWPPCEHTTRRKMCTFTAESKRHKILEVVHGMSTQPSFYSISFLLDRLKRNARVTVEEGRRRSGRAALSGGHSSVSCFSLLEKFYFGEFPRVCNLHGGRNLDGRPDEESLLSSQIHLTSEQIIKSIF